MTVKTRYSIYIEEDSDLDKFIGKVKRKTTLSTEEILEFLINWSYEGYFFNNIDSLHDDFTYLIQKYRLNDAIIVTNKVIIKPNGYNDDQALSCLCAGMENILVDMITKLASGINYPDFDTAYDRIIKDMNVVLSILRKRVKQRIEEVKDKHIKYN